MAQFIYTLEKARRAHGDKVVLDDVTLFFLPGAKIGVVGPNGAGKSSLLRIMAGQDRPTNGEAKLMPGYTVGMLAQEPPLTEDKDVLGNIEEAVHDTKAKLARFNEIAELMATDYSDELMDRDGPAAGGARPRRRLGSRLQARAGHGRAALPAARCRREPALRR